MNREDDIAAEPVRSSRAQCQVVVPRTVGSDAAHSDADVGIERFPLGIVRAAESHLESTTRQDSKAEGELE
jgi:hypothetical protein